jgi:hypothetical protein
VNPAHIHLILNHFSIVGSIFGSALLVVAIVRNTRELIMLSFAFILAIALLSIPVYFTGTAAKEQINHLAGVSLAAIEEHEEAAQFGFAAIECVGALALAGLLLFRTEPVPRWFLTIVLIGSLLTAGAMYSTADKGRLIRHTELSWLSGPPILTAVFSSQWSDFGPHVS